MATTTDETETTELIGSDKVEGTAVYGPDGEQIGTVEQVMIGKTDGRVAYAVLSFGGFLGMGDEHYPVPWEQLTYDTDLGGYRTNLTREQLDAAPKYSGTSDWDTGLGRRVREYYGGTRSR